MKTFLREAYFQVAGVFGAMAFCSMLSGLIEWHGFLAYLVEFWNTNFRPAILIAITPLLRLVGSITGFDIQLPAPLQDYLAVGLMLFFSRLRGITGGWQEGYRKAARSAFAKPIAALGLLTRTILIWPVEVVFLFANLLFARQRFPKRSADEITQIRKAHFYAVLPVLYGIAMLLANLVLMVFPKQLPDQSPPS